MTFHPFPFQEHYDDDTSLPCNNFGTYLIMDSYLTNINRKDFMQKKYFGMNVSIWHQNDLGYIMWPTCLKKFNSWSDFGQF